ncbi:MAG: type I-C CRISPR-associated protein Cas5c [Lachnospiraceae bacterium]|nr:type I-C CRISPR-associated protein Cas5c [Lachnospiraceae bacterium]
MGKNPSATIEVWGDFALWTRPESKVERMTYAVPTPGAIRGLLSSIYSKPPEFYWQVQRIEVLSPIRYISFKRNEVKSKMMKIPKANTYKACILIEDDRTQRQSVVLQDVRYRITAEIVPRATYAHAPGNLMDQFERRVKRGQAFMQPCMGTREFPAYFEWGSSGLQPIKETADLGLMVYDVFNLHKWGVTKQTEPEVSLFHAHLKDGVLEIPPYDSPEVLKGGKETGEYA